jgi:hypothetical protein
MTIGIFTSKYKYTVRPAGCRRVRVDFSSVDYRTGGEYYEFTKVYRFADLGFTDADIKKLADSDLEKYIEAKGGYNGA